MYQINDYVMYGQTGVCRIVDIRNESLCDMPSVSYYILCPVYQAQCTIYAPVEGGRINMRKPLSRQEIDEMIQQLPDEDNSWIEDNNARKAHFDAVIKEGDHQNLVLLIKTLCQERDKRQQEGKKLHIADDKAIKDAEKLLYEELALVLDIDIQDVEDYILENSAN